MAPSDSHFDPTDPLIPGIDILGSTYDWRKSVDADPNLVKHQVVDWSKHAYLKQTFNGKTFSIPHGVQLVDIGVAAHNKTIGQITTTSDEELSISGELEAKFPGVSVSTSASYNNTENKDSSHTTTLVTYDVPCYRLLLPTVEEIRPLLTQQFANDVETMKPFPLYTKYGTHLLSAITLGGRALFLYTTDTKKYGSSTNAKGEAKASVSKLVGEGKANVTAEQKKANKRFNEASDVRTFVMGGDTKYASDKDFPEKAREWQETIPNHPVFTDFGKDSLPTEIWKFAKEKARQDQLRQALAKFEQQPNALPSPGPYLQVRSSGAFENSVSMLVDTTASIVIHFPPKTTDNWYLISPAVGDTKCTLAKESVLNNGALAPVTWAKVYTGTTEIRGGSTQVWKAVSSDPDYVALGFIATSGDSVNKPPPWLAESFRAVHKSILKRANHGITKTYQHTGFDPYGAIVQIDGRYWLADVEAYKKEDYYVLDPKKTTGLE